jgi:septum formation protein
MTLPKAALLSALSKYDFPKVMTNNNLAFLPPNGKKIILASASLRRRELFNQLGLHDYDVNPANIDESEFPKELPRAYTLRIAKKKAGLVSSKHKECFVLAADTVVACGRRILGKADSKNQAISCLNLLSGRRHNVLTAVVINAPNGDQIDRLVTSIVTFKKLGQDEIDNYINSGEWEGKAGGYAIQGIAAAYIRALSGSYSNVVGLPLYETYNMLKGFGFYHQMTDLNNEQPTQ